MIGDARVVGVITARGGSKGLPGKALLDLGGRPIVAWSVEAARASRLIDRTIVSSDDPKIIEAAEAAGGEAPFIRPSRLAQDDSSIYDALFHALDSLDQAFEYVVLLQATSPFRTGRDIDACLRICEAGAPACVSVTAARKSPYWMYRLNAADELQPLHDVEAHRRQDLPPVWMLNGAVYVARIDWLRHSGTFVSQGTRAYRMPPERSIDIDGRIDWLLAQAMLNADSQLLEGES
jgi:CMP-N,N'-diacetyllegionaminic acid synthase